MHTLFTLDLFIDNGQKEETESSKNKDFNQFFTLKLFYLNSKLL
jgi:hypothetical protein